MSEVTLADLQAVGDVAALLAEQADSLSAQQAVELLHAARLADKALKMAIDMLEARAMQQIEQPILVGNTVWAKKPSYKKRPDQKLIQRVVIAKASQPDEDGVAPTAHEAATAATLYMAALYVSPSTLPKTGGVNGLGLGLGDVVNDQHVGFELKTTEID